MLSEFAFRFEDLPVVVMSHGRAKTELFKVATVLKELVPDNKLFCLCVAGEEKAYKTFLASEGLSQMTVCSTSKGMKAADDYVTTSPAFGDLLKKPLILKFDDDVRAIEHVKKSADGSISQEAVSKEIFQEAVTTMARAMLRFGGLVAGRSTSTTTGCQQPRPVGCSTGSSSQITAV